jgi:hypothetical protein
VHPHLNCARPWCACAFTAYERGLRMRGCCACAVVAYGRATVDAPLYLAGCSCAPVAGSGHSTCQIHIVQPILTLLSRPAASLATGGPSRFLILDDVGLNSSFMWKATCQLFPARVGASRSPILRVEFGRFLMG